MHIALAVPIALLASACGSSEAPSPHPVGTASQSIVGGAPDVTHPAVVYLSLSSPGGYSACSGTIIEADPETHIGYVLTAAHCVSAFTVDYAAVGEDVKNPDALYVGIGQLADSRYDSNPAAYDMAVVRVVGVDASTQTLPLASARSVNQVAVGDAVTAVGYGITQPNDHLTGNTVRHQLSLQVVAKTGGQIVSSGFGNVCGGDSGGPLLATIDGAERIVGINVSSDASCFLAENAVPAEPTFDDNLRAFTRETVPASCDLCTLTLLSGSGACVEIGQECDDDPACLEMRLCSRACGADNDCRNDCVARPGASADRFFARARCFCDPCESLCSEEGGFCAHLADYEKERARRLAGGGAADAASGASRDAGTQDDAQNQASDDGGCVVSAPRRASPRSSGFIALAALAALAFARRARAQKRSGSRYPTTPAATRL